MTFLGTWLLVTLIAAVIAAAIAAVIIGISALAAHFGVGIVLLGCLFLLMTFAISLVISDIWK